MKESKFETGAGSSKKEKQEGTSENKVIPKQAEKFYKKPEDREEMVENMKTLKEIPKKAENPKVVVKLGNPEKSHKFVYMTDEDGRKYVIALPIEKKEYHKDIVDLSKKLYDKDLFPMGGGYIHTEGDKLIIDKSSGSYGRAPKRDVKEILEDTFPEMEVETRGKGLKDEIQEKIEEMNKDYEDEIDFENEVQKELYTKVLDDKAIKLGFDYTSKPKNIDGRDDLAYMIYSSETGGFGFDTLYVGRKDESGEVETKAVIKETGYIHPRDMKVESGVLEINYKVGGEEKSVSIPLDNLEDFEPEELDINEWQRKALENYQKQREEIRDNYAGPSSELDEIFHGVSHE